MGTGEIVGSNVEVSSEVASALPRGSSVEAMSARTQLSGLPNDFFEVRDLHSIHHSTSRQTKDRSLPVSRLATFCTQVVMTRFCLESASASLLHMFGSKEASRTEPRIKSIGHQRDIASAGRRQQRR